jgi:cytochrome c-type biogenesis protein CcmF
MIALAGFGGVLVALCCAALLAWNGLRGVRSPNTIVRPVLVPIVIGMLAGAALAFASLEWAIITDNFSVKYVAQHSARATPFLFKLATAWAALEGSIVLWGLVLAVYTWFVLRQLREGDRLAAGALGVLGLIGVFFFGVVATIANPFELLSPVPLDGPGPNPLLQNHWLMAIHPPLLYAGYVGFSVPFAFAISALLIGEPGTGWVRRTQRWSLVAWMFLTAGITCGAWWSYAVLGWGGYWAWDPVENASFLPWLVATAYIHSAIIQAKRGMLQAWSIALVICTFALTIFGTFLTRSGVVASVHSFTQSTIGPALLGFLVVVLVASFGLFALRAQLVASSPKLESLASREGSFLCNNLLLTLFAFTVLIGTLYPILVEAFSGSQVSVGAPFFDRMAIPLSLTLLLVMGLGPLLPYRAASARLVWTRVRLPVQLGLAVGALAVVTGLRQPYVVFVLVVGTAIAASTVRQLVQSAGRVRREHELGWTSSAMRVVQGDRSFWGGQLSHLGVVIVVIGIATAGNLAKRATVEMDQGGPPVRVAGYQLSFRSTADHDESNRSVRVASVQLRHGGHLVTTLRPRLSQFTNSVQAIGTPAIYTSPAGDDVYLAITRLDSGHLTAHFYRYPKIGLLWLGGFLTAAGALFALALPRRRRIDRAARIPGRQTTGPHRQQVRVLQRAAGAMTVVLAAIVALGMISGARSHPDRARELASRLRCPVCQAESVADSPAQTAQEMNSLIVQQVRQGKSDKEILAFFRQRYGDWILLDPPARGRTLWLWLLPGAGLVIGVVAVARRAGRAVDDSELSESDRDRVWAAVRAEVLTGQDGTP